MVEAARLYGQVAEQGRAVAQNMLGMFYMLGCGELHSNQDLDAAARLFRLAADQGDADAQYLLGFLCECGKGTTWDMVEVLRWYQAAAAQHGKGASWALAQLDVLYEKGMREVARYAAASD
mmetsp:Transcript_31908/g.79571  ORF Transcript_31908/g.79571 Transcript_31908/m.79571 type:complete len:121 (-) Transcript_31908:536-898(-)